MRRLPIPNALEKKLLQRLSSETEAIKKANNLKEAMADILNLIAARKLSKKAARERVETWKSESWQPDVADYFLNGPGQKESPFKEFLAEVSDGSLAP